MEPLDNSRLKVTLHGYLQTIQRLIHFAPESYYLGNDAKTFHGFNICMIVFGLNSICMGLSLYKTRADWCCAIRAFVVLPSSNTHKIFSNVYVWRLHPVETCLLNTRYHTNLARLSSWANLWLLEALLIYGAIQLRCFFPPCCWKTLQNVVSSHVLLNCPLRQCSRQLKMDSRVMHRFNVGGTMAMK